MKFSILAKLFSKLESTDKRLEMIDILSNFFERIKEKEKFEDLDKIIYLLQGQLVPNIKQFPKLGIAENFIIEALKIPSGLNKKEIKKRLVKKGDIGSTAEEILKIRKEEEIITTFVYIKKKERPSIEISELYKQLKIIAKIEGEKTQEKKVRFLHKLISIISPLETKYLLRIITSTLRVGVQSSTIIEGLAYGFTGDRKNKEFIEKSYNLFPDLGEISKILAKKGLEAVKKIDIEYGTPILSMLASRERYSEFINRLGVPFIAEHKLDGERLQIHKIGQEVILFSRRLLKISDRYPDVCEVIRKNIHAENVIIEGEIVAMDSVYEKMLPFQVLSQRRRKYEVEEISKKVPVCLFLFDLLKYEDISFIDKTLPIRRKKLEEIVKEKDELRLVKSVLINSTEELVDFFKKSREEGTEGIMAKTIKENSIYQAGNRGYLWLKLKALEGGKLKDTIDVVLVGAFYGRGRRKGLYGTYIGAVYDPESGKFQAFTRIASGWTDEIMETLMKDMKQLELERIAPDVICEDTPDVWLKPEVVIEIIGDEITISDKFSSLGYSMRFPVFQRFRPDKIPTDITTIDEIKKLYEIQ